MDFHKTMMQRCAQLAESALGKTYPNPIVGCVITYNQNIIGEGVTSEVGENHAEINAMASVKNKTLLKESTMYVSLEPCSHYGNTPPCSLAIKKHKIPNVVIGCLDPNPKVNGNGIKMLKDAGINVTVGIEEKLCQEVNRRFFTHQTKGRPYIILKWAQTANGYFAPKDASQKWITNRYSKQLSHLWRTQEHTILVGTNTALNDNPTLTARLWESKNQPIRVLIDKDLKVPKSHQILNGDAKTIVLNQMKNEVSKNIKHLQIDFEQDVVEEILKVLYSENIQSVIVEGGAKTLSLFIEKDLWDEARILKAKSTIWEDGILAPKITGRQVAQQQLLDDELSIFRNPNQNL